MRAGLEAGMKIDAADAVRWLTINPARALGIDKVTGSLEAGKNADVVIWSGDPFSVYARAERVFIDGALLYDRSEHDQAAVERLRHRARPCRRPSVHRRLRGRCHRRE